MDLNADFSQPALVHSERENWVASPMAGVERRMLDRIGDEVARATSIVRYAPGSHFSAHTHGGGEEFLVLDGVFQDEHGDYPAGTYVRNPPTSSHTPGSDTGCTIFVKLWQFDPEDRTQITTHIDDALEQMGDGSAQAVLFEDERERVVVHDLPPDASLTMAEPGGTEVLVLRGAGVANGETSLERGTWLRLPEDVPFHVESGEAGLRVWLKTGHLPYAAPPAV